MLFCVKTRDGQLSWNMVGDKCDDFNDYDDFNYFWMDINEAPAYLQSLYQSAERRSSPA